MIRERTAGHASARLCAPSSLSSLMVFMVFHLHSSRCQRVRFRYNGGWKSSRIDFQVLSRPVLTCVKEWVKVGRMSTDVVFGIERIKWIRIQLGESQQQFAERLGVDSNMISRYENGHARPVQAKIIRALLQAEHEVDAT